MKVGDKLLYVGNDEFGSGFTHGKQYEIYKIEQNEFYFNGDRCCWILDDRGGHVYFKECDAVDDYFRFIKGERKDKINKIINYEKN